MKCIFFFCSVRSLTSCVLHIFVSASFSRHNNYQVQAHWIIVGIFFSHTFYFSFFHLRLHGICIQWKLVCKCLLLSFTGKYVKIFYEFILLPLGWLHWSSCTDSACILSQFANISRKPKHIANLIAFYLLAREKQYDFNGNASGHGLKENQIAPDNSKKIKTSDVKRDAKREWGTEIERHEKKNKESCKIGISSYELYVQRKLRLRRLYNISDRRYLIFVMESFHCLTTLFFFSRLSQPFLPSFLHFHSTVSLSLFPCVCVCVHCTAWLKSFLTFSILSSRSHRYIVLQPRHMNGMRCKGVYTHCTLHAAYMYEKMHITQSTLAVATWCVHAISYTVKLEMCKTGGWLSWFTIISLVLLSTHSFCVIYDFD